MIGNFPKRYRRGAAAIEFAVSAAILFLFVATAIELSRMNMLRHSVDNAAYEAARAGIILGANTTQIDNAAHEIMRSISARGVDVQINPPDFDDTTEEIEVIVRVPTAENGFITGKFMKSQFFSGQCRLTRDDV